MEVKESKRIIHYTLMHHINQSGGPRRALHNTMDGIYISSIFYLYVHNSAHITHYPHENQVTL